MPYAKGRFMSVSCLTSISIIGLRVCLSACVYFCDQVIVRYDLTKKDVKNEK